MRRITGVVLESGLFRTVFQISAPQVHIVAAWGLLARKNKLLEFMLVGNQLLVLVKRATWYDSRMKAFSDDAKGLPFYPVQGTKAMDSESRTMLRVRC